MMRINGTSPKPGTRIPTPYETLATADRGWAGRRTLTQIIEWKRVTMPPPPVRSKP
jgi:hypothetical protein